MVKTITRDILTVTEGIICQQVNCQGVMGTGLAKQIADKWCGVEQELPKKAITGDDFVKQEQQDLPAKTAPDPDAKPIWEMVAEISAQVPDEDWDKLPTDLARNFDHYTQS